MPETTRYDGGIYGGQNYGGGNISGGNLNDYGGAGGAIGGYNLDGTANYSGYTGVGSGSGYNSFTPTNLNLSILPNVAAPGVGVINNAQFVLAQLQSGLVPKTQVSNIVAWIHTQLISLFGTKDKSLKQYQGQAIALGQQIQNAADTVLMQNGVTSTDVTPIVETTAGFGETTTKSILEQLSALLGGGAPTAANFEAPPNLYQVTPNSQTTGSNNNMSKILILVAVIAAAYFLYKKYA